MKYNMTKWLSELIHTGKKKPLPILSFPAVSLLGVSVRELICDSSLQARGMKLIAEQTEAAAAVSFMDLSVEAECFGAQISVSDNEVPTVKEAIIADEASAEALAVPRVGSGRSGIYIEAIRQASAEITDRPVLAGMIGPFSLGARLLEMSEFMIACYDEPDTVHSILEKTTAFLIEYGKAFKAAGANGIVVAEPVSGLLSPSLEHEFSAPYMKKIVDALKDDSFAVIYHNCGGNTLHMVDSFLSFGASAYHFGNAIDMKQMLPLFPRTVPVLGNLDPAGVLRMGTATQVHEQTLRILQDCAQYENFILSSGCDIPPATPWENIGEFFRTNEQFYEKA